MTASAAFRVVFALATVLTAASARAQETSAPAEFTVATYNINYGNPDLRTVAQTIRQCKADLVVLQETNSQSEAFLHKELANAYPHMVFHNAPAAGGFAMLSKTPIENPRYLPPLASAGGWFGTQTARATLAGREMLIVNVHLTATVPAKGMNAKAMLALFAQKETVRDKEIRAIVGGLPKRCPVLVLGDFNSIPALSAVPGFMAKSGFTDCMAEVIRDADSVRTWHWNLGGADYSSRLDYIFSARLGATLLAGKVVEAEGSDHFLVLGSFKTIPVPILLGEAETQAVNIVYLLDEAETTPERAAKARDLVAASVAKLGPAQNFCVMTPGRKDPVVPPELSPASDVNRKLAAEGMSKEPSGTDALLPAVRRAMALLDDEAAPKALFILSDRAAKDPGALKSVCALCADKRVQLYVLDAEGTPVADAGGAPAEK